MIAQSALHILEFDKIQQKLVVYAKTLGGRRLCLDMSPATELAVCRRLLDETADALDIITEHGSIPLEGCEDISEHLNFLAAGGVLDCRELLQFYRFLRSVDRAYSYLPKDLIEHQDELSQAQRFVRERDPLQQLQRSNEQSNPFNYLISQIQLLNPLHHLCERIDQCIASETEIYDRATPELFAIRRNIATAQERIKAQLESILKRQAEHLSDAVVTIRQDRYVVPVKADSRKSIPGIIHDTSSSGATVFIEPMPVVELNNKICELKLAEEKEMYRICKMLSEALAAESTTILRDQVVLSDIDFVQAKALLASELRCIKPKLTEHGTVLKQARHPLIDSSQVVPIDIEIGREFTAIMITGPNTGGKTVSLKTCGLLVLMAQAGLLIPAAEESEVRVFTQVLPDIGDEQSIEQNLSTFSAHLTALIKIIETADHNSLVLLDEPGAGTDPAEGAALAMAIIDFFLQQKSEIIATTHYPELKNYALNRPGVINACCEFDTETLRPTYRLLLGVPGVSNALLISQKLGLPEEIITAAKCLLAGEKQELESQLQALENSHKVIADLKEQIADLEKLSEERAIKLAEKEAEVVERNREIIQKAKRRASEILQQAQSEAGDIISELKELKQQAKFENLDQALPQARQLQQELVAKGQVFQPAKPKGKLTASDISVGSRYISTSGFSGVAAEPPDNSGRVLLKSGAMSLRISVKELMPASEPDLDKAPNKSRSGNDKNRNKAKQLSSITNRLTTQKHLTATSEIKLIGKRVDDALYELDSFLDDAVLAGLTKVRIVHGKGTGALRQAVHEKLKRDRRVSAYHLATFGEGDSGVTIVEMS